MPLPSWHALGRQSGAQRLDSAGLDSTGFASLAGWQSCHYPAGKALGKEQEGGFGQDPTGNAFLAGWQECHYPAGMPRGG